MATAVSIPADLSPAPAPRRRGRPPKNPAPAEAPGASTTPAPPLAAPAEEEVMGDYERERAARIRENMERMQKLGILDLAHTLTQQKTLGHHTSCCKCQIVQGQFCGDCLYMRYGENVLEVKKNPNWICPVCRGICNCSICRTKKGWFPTGAAYRKVVGLGYKSVAHFLIATHRASSVNSEDSSSADKKKLLSAKSETSCISSHDGLDANESPNDGETSSKAKLNKASLCQVKKNSDGDKDDSRSESVVTSDCQDDQANKDAGCVTPSSKPMSRKRKYVERNPDCIASRLRSRLNMP